MIDISIEVKLQGSWPATNNFFEIVDLVEKIKAFGCAHVPCCPHKRRQWRAK